MFRKENVIITENTRIVMQSKCKRTVIKIRIIPQKTAMRLTNNSIVFVRMGEKTLTLSPA